MVKIFISYRRADSGKDIIAISNKLIEVFGEENIFVDKKSIEGGEDFRHILVKEVISTDVVLVVIGKQWEILLKERDSNKQDFVKTEVQYALQNQKCTVIPILLDDTQMPNDNSLPVEIRELAYRNALRVRFEPNDFANDMNKLIKTIQNLPHFNKPSDNNLKPKSDIWVKAGVIIAGLSLLVAIITLFITNNSNAPSSSSATNTPNSMDIPLIVEPYSFTGIRLFELETTRMIDLYSQVYIDDNNLYLVDLADNAQAVMVDSEPTGEKYAPILFDLAGALILSYVLEVGNDFYIRIVNLDISDGAITLQLPDGIVVDAETRIAFNENLLVFDGIDTINNNQRNIYMLNMTGSETGDQLPVLFISNAKDPASVEGDYKTFIFVAIGNPTGSVFRYDGYTSDGQAYLYPLDGLGKSCKRPLAEEYDYDIQYWFLCDVNGSWTLFVNSNASQYRQNREPSSPASNLDITFKNITLGLDANSIFGDNGNQTFLFMGVDNIEFIQEGHSMFTLRD